MNGRALRRGPRPARRTRSRRGLGVRLSTPQSLSRPLYIILICALCLLGGAQPVAVESSSLCPCATSGLPAISAAESAEYPDIDTGSYGIGCGKHDVGTAVCNRKSTDTTCIRVMPVPLHCSADDSWCGASWCYVNTSGCQLTHAPSDYFPSSLRFYSYATCGYADEFANGKRAAEALRGSVLRVGFLSNSGGWQGAYNPSGHHARDEAWHGPMVTLIQTLEAKLGVHINISSAPSSVYDASGSSSTFSQCVFATSLGFLDLCVAMFTITDQRLGWTPMGQVTVYSLPHSSNIPTSSPACPFPSSCVQIR